MDRPRVLSRSCPVVHGLYPGVDGMLLCSVLLRSRTSLERKGLTCRGIWLNEL